MTPDEFSFLIYANITVTGVIGIAFAITFYFCWETIKQVSDAKVMLERVAMARKVLSQAEQTLAKFCHVPQRQFEVLDILQTEVRKVLDQLSKLDGVEVQINHASKRLAQNAKANSLTDQSLREHLAKLQHIIAKGEIVIRLRGQQPSLLNHIDDHGDDDGGGVTPRPW